MLIAGISLTAGLKPAILGRKAEIENSALSWGKETDKMKFTRIRRTRSKIMAIALAGACIVGSMAITACSSSGDESADDSANASAISGSINVITREDGSGTRSAFAELIDIEADDGGDLITANAAVSNSTAVVLTNVANDSGSIGYISLGSLDDSVKAISVDGVEASAENVSNGSYSLARPFNVVSGGDLSELAQDFLNFILSSDGQSIIEEEGYIAVADGDAYSASGLSGTVVVAGSSSVTPVMEVLAEEYEALNPDVDIQVQQSDSSTGVQSVIEGSCDLGMASRELSDSEIEQGVSSTVIAQDGIAVIVNLENSISNLTTEQIAGIYTGEITDWSEISN